MAPETGSVRRKRTRIQHDDELSAAVPSTDAISSTKKRRLNDTATSSTAAPKGFSAITSAIGSVFGYGRSSNPKTASSGEQQNYSSKSAYDEIPGSDDQVRTVSPKKKAMRPAVSYTKLKQKSPKSPRQPSKNIYDVPSSEDDELEFSTPMGDQSNTPTRTRQMNASTRKSSSKAGRSQAEEAENGTSEETFGTPSRNRGKRTLSTTGTESMEQKSQSARKPAVKALPARQTSSTEDRSPSKQPPPTPKGILTPRHRKPGRPRKSVAFDNEDNKPAEVYFEDLLTKSKHHLTHSPATKSEETAKAKSRAISMLEEVDEEDEDSEDDEVCVICSKPESKRGNEIIFCDNCNKAVHQKCYNVLEIPEDDWFCKDCMQEDVASEIIEDSARIVGIHSAIPDVPNFEQHLQTMQRVLIDRCLGTRRLKLKGQEEAYEKTYQLVGQTVLAGEGNSMMVIGARGCGKTLLVESVVSDLAAECQDTFHVVRLNGFIHTDDKLALKEIWRQLGKEMEVEDDLVNKVSLARHISRQDGASLCMC